MTRAPAVAVAFVTSLLLVTWPTSVTSAAAAQLIGNVKPAVTAVPGKVGVVATSAPVQGSVAVIVQNGTRRPVDRVRVSGVATRPDGSAVERASTRQLVPAVLPPGAIALTQLEFRDRALRSDTRLTFRVKSSSAGVKDRSTVDVVDAHLSPPMEGDVAQELSMTVTNSSRAARRGVLTVATMCFGEARMPTQLTVTNTQRTELQAGASIPVVVKLRELCPSYLVGATLG